MRRGPTFTLDSCRSLHSVSLHMDIDNTPVYAHYLYNTVIWEPILHSLLTAPPSSLSTFTSELTFYSFENPDPPSLHIHNLLGSLDWTLLERVMTRHPELTKIDIQPQDEIFDLFDQAQIRQYMPRRVADAVTFTRR